MYLLFVALNLRYFVIFELKFLLIILNIHFHFIIIFYSNSFFPSYSLSTLSFIPCPATSRLPLLVFNFHFDFQR